MDWDETDDHDFSDSELEYHSEPLQRNYSMSAIRALKSRSRRKALKENKKKCKVCNDTKKYIPIDSNIEVECIYCKKG